MIAPFLRPIRRKLSFGLLTLIPLQFVLGDTPLQELQSSAKTWADLRSEMTRLESDWDSEKNVLTASISGLTQKAEQMALAQEALEAETAKDRREINELRDQNDAVAESLKQANTRMRGVAQKLLALRPALPPRLATALELPYKSLNSPELADGERAQHVMTILNRCNQFNQAFVLAEEIIPTSPGAEPQLLEIIYLGLAQACAIDRAANKAYVGRPVDGQWTWTAEPDLAAEIANMIAIYQDRAEPTFITVPMQVTGGVR